MRILYVTTIGGTMVFFKSFIKTLLDAGNVVDIAANVDTSPVPKYYIEWGCEIFPLSCTRSPLNKGTYLAIKEIEELVKNNHYDIVHCHTPIAAACTRISCRKIRKMGTKVFYTAHGFHFYKGAPLKNWLIYYPIEWICAHWTDILLTINQEDYMLAQKKMKARNVEYVPGIGVDIQKFEKKVADRENKRKEVGIPEDAFVLLSVGEVNVNKNHEVVLRAVSQIPNKNVHYVIAGMGELKKYLYNLSVELGIEKQVHLLGYREDVAELYKAVDLYVHPSLREGLPVAVMEAIAAKIPVICSNIRGCKDLVNKECLFNPKDVNSILGKIRESISNNMSEIVQRNYDNLQKFGKAQVIRKMYGFYFPEKNIDLKENDLK